MYLALCIVYCLQMDQSLSIKKYENIKVAEEI